MAEEALLEVEGVSKVYGGRKVVDQVSLRVHRGEIVALLGRNGAGKTTTLGMAMGLVTPDAGRVVFRGQVVSKMPVYKRSRKGMGFVPREPSIFKKLTVEENLLAILELDGRQSQCTELLDEYELIPVAGQRACTLSGADMRRLEICRAMISRPSMLLLDEPSAGIDPMGWHKLESLIIKLAARGTGVLIADHNVRETLGYCDRAYIMHNGRNLLDGPPSDLWLRN